MSTNSEAAGSEASASEMEGPEGSGSGVERPGMPNAVAHGAELALERKALDVVALDLRGLSSAADFFLLATGNSDIQVKAIADHLIDELKKVGVRPLHVEGLQGGRWVLVDYVDWVAHIFHPSAREFYGLEHLWSDAPRIPFADTP
jgi:ribosome-associated protein